MVRKNTDRKGKNEFLAKKKVNRTIKKDKFDKTYIIANSLWLLSESSKGETKTIYYLNLDPEIIIHIAILDT